MGVLLMAGWVKKDEKERRTDRGEKKTCYKPNTLQASGYEGSAGQQVSSQLQGQRCL